MEYAVLIRPRLPRMLPIRFGLLELLIFAALVLRGAILPHDSPRRPRTDLPPALNGYVQELPKDPWGNEYLLDAGVGVIISVDGADQHSRP